MATNGSEVRRGTHDAQRVEKDVAERSKSKRSPKSRCIRTSLNKCKKPRCPFQFNRKYFVVVLDRERAFPYGGIYLRGWKRRKEVRAQMAMVCFLSRSIDSSSW